MRTMIPAALSLALAVCTAAAQAQAIYRCGDSYSQQPCAGGKAIVAEQPTPTSAERKQSAAAAQRDARLADSLEKERVQREAQPAQLYVPPPRFEATAQPYKSPEKAATRKLDVFTASAPGSKPTKDKKKGKTAKDAADAGKPAGQGDRAAAGGTLAVRR